MPKPLPHEIDRADREYLSWIRERDPFDRLVHYVKIRDQVYRAKEEGEPKPWTSDPIIRTYRFCNNRRMDDKVSRWLLENWYQPYYGHAWMVPAAALARFVNLPRSLALITSDVFSDEARWPNRQILEKLRKHKNAGNVVFNGAYMVRGNDGLDKVDCVVNYYIASLFAQRGSKTLWGKVLPDLVDTNSMESTHSSIIKLYGFGSFMAGQVVADLRWSLPGKWKDKNDWAPIGPGSARGLNRVLGRNIKTTWPGNTFLASLREVRDKLVKTIPESVKRLELHDFQNIHCEFDKYERALWNEGKPKQLYRPA